MTLQWQDKRTDDRGYYSTCHRYSICSVSMNGEEWWQAWKLVPGGAWFAPLKLSKSETEVIAAAEADAETAII